MKTETEKLFEELKTTLTETLKEAPLLTEVPKTPKRLKSIPPNQIMAIRFNLNMSREEFAEGLNITVETLETWELGLKKPSGASLKLIILAKTFPTVVFR